MTKLGNGERYGAKDVLVKSVSVWSIVGIIYCMCCAGAFGIEEMIPEGGPGMTLIILIALPFLWALPYSYLVAELGSARPVEGGKLMWVKEALGEYWFGIMAIVNFIWGLIANTVYVVLAVEYLGTRIPAIADGMPAYVLKVGLIMIFFIINLLGIKEVSWVSTAISVAVAALFLLIAVVGFANASQNPFEPMVNTTDVSDFGFSNPVLAFGATLGIGIWMYCGYDEISLIGGEVKGSQKVIPKAIIIAIPLIALTYILPTLAGMASIGDTWEDWSTAPDGIGYHSVLEQVGGGAGFFMGWVFVVVAILGQLSIYNVCIMAASRTSMILADENMGPKALGKLSKNKGMPWVALIVVVVVTTALLGTPDNPTQFTFLVLIDAFFAIMVAALVTASYVVLKRRMSPDEIPFKAPGGNVGWKIMVGLICFFIICFIYMTGMDYFLGGVIVMMCLPIVYCIFKRVWGGLTVKEPKLYPADPRTKLGFGDVTKIGGYYCGFAVINFVGRLFLSWFESDENSSYWAARSDFGGYEEWVVEEFPHLTRTNDLGEVWIPGYYEQTYETGLFSNLDAMLDAVLYLGIGAAVVGVILLLIGKALRKDDARLKAEIISKLN